MTWKKVNVIWFKKKKFDFDNQIFDSGKKFLLFDWLFFCCWYKFLKKKNFKDKHDFF